MSAENLTASQMPAAAPGPLLQMMTGYWVTQALYVAAKLGIADLLTDGPLSCADLAARSGAHAPSLRRMLRALASVGVFSEIDHGRFALTPLATLLRSADPHSVRALAIMYAEEQYRAWGDMLYSVRTGQPAFEHQFGMDVFEYFARNPRASAVFNEAMSGLTIQVAAAVAATYDFSSCATIVDVGGNRGTVLAAILQRHSDSRGILFDRPHVVATAGEVLAAAGVEHRCTIVGGDFFEAVPPGGDAYLLASILHDWDDDRCVEILRRCRQAMADTGTLLVVELVLPPGNEPFVGKWVDLHMLVMASGRERTEEEYGKVLLAAGFHLKRVRPLPNGQSIVEAVPV